MINKRLVVREDMENTNHRSLVLENKIRRRIQYTAVRKIVKTTLQQEKENFYIHMKGIIRNVT